MAGLGNDERRAPVAAEQRAYGSMAVRVGFGVLVWLGLLLAPVPDAAHRPVLLFLWLALLVLTPLALDLVHEGETQESPLFQTARYLQPFAGLIASLSFLLPPGVLAGTLAIAWLPVTGMAAIAVVRRELLQAGAPFEERWIDLGVLMLLPAAFWLWAAQMGLAPFGETYPRLLLHTVHFHFAGCGSLLLAGLAGRRMRGIAGTLSPLLALSSIALLPGPLLPFLEDRIMAALGAVILAGGHSTLAFILIHQLLDSVQSLPGRLLLLVSALGAAAGTLAAAWFAVLDASRRFLVTDEMFILLHGWPAGMAFAVLGVLGWRMAQSG